MGVLRIPFRSLMAALLVVLSLSGASLAAAQVQDFEPDLYLSQLSGFEVTVSGPEYSIVNAELQHYSNGEGEVVEIESPTGISFLEVSFYDDTDSATDSIDVYLSSLESASESIQVLDSGVIGDHQYSFVQVEYDGFEFFFLIQVEEDVVGNVDILESMLTTEDDLVGMLAAAQDEVAIDGTAFMANIDPEALASVITGGGSIADDTGATPSVDSVESVTLSSANVEVALGTQMMFDGPVERGEAVESVKLQGPEVAVLVAVGETGLPAETVLDEYVSGVSTANPTMEPVADGTSGDSIWRLLWISEGGSAGQYMLVVVDSTTHPGNEVLIASMLPSDAVGASIEHIQNHVLIDGEPSLSTIDADEIQELVDEFAASEDATVGETATSTATEEASDSKIGDPRSDARLPGQESTPEESGNTSETGDQPTETETTSAPVDVTLTLTDTSWEGGVFGRLIEWNDEVWVFVPEHKEDILSDFDNKFDEIALHSNFGSGDAWLAITVFEPDLVTPDEYMDYWTSGDFVADEEESNQGVTVEVLATRSRNGNAAMVVRYIDAEGKELVLVRQVSVIETGETVLVSMFAPPEEVQELFELTLSDVTIDDQPVFSVISVSQLARALED